MKMFKAPEPLARQRRQSGAKISLHVQRDLRGFAEPHDVVSGRPRWTFTLRWKAPDGLYRCRNLWCETQREAEIEAEKQVEAWQREQILGEHKTAEEARTGNNLCDLFLDMKQHEDSSTRQGTVEGYRKDLARFVRPFFGDLPVAEVTPDHVTNWKTKYAADGKARTRQKRVNLLASLFLLAIERGWRQNSPVLSQHRVRVLKVGERDGKLRGDQRVAQVVNAEQLGQIIGNLDEADPALRLMVHLTGWMGFRLREVTHLRAEDIKLNEDGSGFVTVSSDVPCSCRDCKTNDGTRLTKAGRARLVPVPPEHIDALRSYMIERSAKFGDRGWLFPEWRRRPRQRTQPGGIRVPRTVTGRFQAAALEAGLSGLVFHDLRATAKTLLILRGANVTAVDVALGHQLPGMSSIYVQLAQQPALFYRSVFSDWQPRLTLEGSSRKTA
jgi:integrase